MCQLLQLMRIRHRCWPCELQMLAALSACPGVPHDRRQIVRSSAADLRLHARLAGRSVGVPAHGIWRGASFHRLRRTQFIRRCAARLLASEERSTSIGSVHIKARPDYAGMYVTPAGRADYRAELTRIGRRFSLRCCIRRYLTHCVWRVLQPTPYS